MKLKLNLNAGKIAPELKGDSVFLSGTVHLALNPGQDLSASKTEPLKETEHYLPSSKRRKRTSSARDSDAARSSKAGKQAGGSGRSGVTLLDLIEGGFLEAGENILSCSYQGVTDTADLTERGTIVWDDNEFSNPTAWAIKYKRLHNPAKVADDGWKSIVFNNENVLAHYRAEFLDDPQGKSQGKSVATRTRRASQG